MNFYNYLITESLNYDDIIRLLDKNCKTFIKEMQSGKNFLLRLSPKYATNQDLIVSTIRKNRKPTDTPQDVHEEMDDMLKSKFGWKPRSEGLFAWISKRKSGIDNFWISNYKRARLVFPVGTYKYVYSPEIKDVYNKYERFVDDVGYYEDEFDTAEAAELEAKNRFLDWFWDEGLPTYTNKGFAKIPIGKDNMELMLSAPAVYLLSPELIPLLNDEYKLGFDEKHWDRPNYEIKRKAQSETPELSNRRR